MPGPSVNHIRPAISLIANTQVSEKGSIRLDARSLSQRGVSLKYQRLFESREGAGPQAISNSAHFRGSNECAGGPSGF